MRPWGCLQVLYREYAAGMYSKMPFALSLCCVEIPYNTLEAALFSCVRPTGEMSDSGAVVMHRASY